MNENDWYDHPAYWKLISDERKYEAISQCEGPCCGLTCTILSLILFVPLITFICIECMK